MAHEPQTSAPLETRATATISVNIPHEEWNETRADIKELRNELKALKANQPDELLTINQVCEALKIGRCTFYTYKNNGKLKVSKIGKKFFVRRSDLDEAINGGTV